MLLVRKRADPMIRFKYVSCAYHSVEVGLLYRSFGLEEI